MPDEVVLAIVEPSKRGVWRHVEPGRSLWAITDTDSLERTSFYAVVDSEEEADRIAKQDGDLEVEEIPWYEPGTLNRLTVWNTSCEITPDGKSNGSGHLNGNKYWPWDAKSTVSNPALSWTWEQRRRWVPETASYSGDHYGELMVVGADKAMVLQTMSELRARFSAHPDSDTTCGAP